MSALDRFKAAQNDPRCGVEVALRELRTGQKRSHWIWYVCPQLAGLGSSPMAARYGLDGIGEAAAYLRDSMLRERLLLVMGAIADALAGRPGAQIVDVMGSAVDARKLVSSMTLFREVAKRLNAAEPSDDYATLETRANAILHVAAEQRIPECQFTNAHLEHSLR